MHAGKKFGEGVYGATYDFESLGKILRERRIQVIRLHWFDKHLILKTPSEIKAFMRYLPTQDCVAKVFKSYSIGIDKRTFKEELSNMQTIFKLFGQKRTQKMTTLTHLQLYDFNFVAAYFEFKDGNYKYVTFTTRCDADLEHVKFTNHRIKLLIRHILPAFVTMQSKSYMHSDIKPDNIIYCHKTRRYKLIDWGLLRQMDSTKYVHVNTKFGSPVAHYLNGLPAFIALNIFYYANLYAYPDWCSSAIFKELYAFISKEMQTATRSYDEYKNRFDLFGFGMSIAYLVHKYNLNWAKFRPIVLDMISLKRAKSAKNILDR